VERGDEALSSDNHHHKKAVIARLDRATQYGVTPVVLTNASGILDRPVKPGDDN
jgi:purine nucleoside phosphorylase